MHTKTEIISKNFIFIDMFILLSHYYNKKLIIKKICGDWTL
jgi:hypothetical protein